VVSFVFWHGTCDIERNGAGAANDSADMAWLEISVSATDSGKPKITGTDEKEQSHKWTRRCRSNEFGTKSE